MRWAGTKEFVFVCFAGFLVRFLYPVFLFSRAWSAPWLRWDSGLAGWVRFTIFFGLIAPDFEMGEMIHVREDDFLVLSVHTGVKIAQWNGNSAPWASLGIYEASSTLLHGR